MSRIGGAFPFPISEAATGGGYITLGSGGVYYPPAGQYLFTTGGMTSLETFDPIAQTWRNLLPPVLVGQAFATDGYNYRLINLSGVIVGARITGAGSGGTNGIGFTATGVAVTFAGPGVTGALTATGYAIVGGAVSAPTVNQAGSGFLVPPQIIIDPPPPGGIQATAICTLNASTGIASITMINPGAGYTAIPNFYIQPQFGSYAGSTGAGGSVAAGVTPPPGLVNLNSSVGLSSTNGLAVSGPTGALLNPAALTGSGTLTGIGMIQNGSFYTGTTIPAVTITGMSGATAVAIPSFSIQSITLTAGGSGYGTGSPPFWESSLALVAPAFNNNTLIPIEARGVTTVVGGAVATFAVEFPGFGLQGVPLITVNETSSNSVTTATGTAVVGGITDTSQLQAKVQ